MERDRGMGMVEQPPAKRMRLAVPVGAGGAGGGGGMMSPRSRRLRQTLLVVLFLVRAGARATVTAVSQIGGMVHHVNHVLRVIARKIDGLHREVARGHREIENLRNEVARLTHPCSNCHANQHTRLELNQEHENIDGSNTNIRLGFQNGLKPPIYTDENVTSENNAPIKLAMFQGDNIVTTGVLSEAKVEILVLRGDFSNKYRDNWTEDDFDKHIVQGRDGQDLVLRTAWLINGEVELSQIRFKEGSCRKKVIVAARVCKSEKTSVRVQEAIMKPVTVLDRRNKPNEKRHPPRLDDELYRLEEISRDGVYHKRLQEAKIYKVEGFLKALHEDSNKLRGILKMEKNQNSWSKLTKHARECVLEDRQELKRYKSEDGKVVLFFNCVHDLIGAAFPNEFVACQRFDTAQNASANKWKRQACDKLEGISPDYVMKDNIPQPISPSTDVAATSAVQASTASQHANQVAPPQAEFFSQEEYVTGLISPIANCGPILANPDHLDTCYGQGQHGQQQIMPSSPQNSYDLVETFYQFESPSVFGMFDSSGASSFSFEPHHFPEPHQLVPAAAPAGITVAGAQPSFPEQDLGSNCFGFPGSGHPDEFQ